MRTIGNGTIEKYDASGHGTIFVSRSQLRATVPGNPVDVSIVPIGLAFDNNGNIFVSGDWAIMKIDPTGQVSAFATTGLDGALQIAFDNNGNLWAANNFNDTVVKFDPSGQGSLFTNASAGLHMPTGVAFDKSDNLYVANDGIDTIFKFDPAAPNPFMRLAPVSRIIRHSTAVETCTQRAMATT